MINDVREPVRCLAAQLIGRMNKVSQTFLEQTLDKKLMSNMRVKKSSHERQEWSSVFKCYFAFNWILSVCLVFFCGIRTSNKVKHQFIQLEVILHKEPHQALNFPLSLFLFLDKLKKFFFLAYYLGPPPLKQNQICCLLVLLWSKKNLDLLHFCTKAGLVASGEWSSGKKWADDAPKVKIIYMQSTNYFA